MVKLVKACDPPGSSASSGSVDQVGSTVPDEFPPSRRVALTGETVETVVRGLSQAEMRSLAKDLHVKRCSTHAAYARALASSVDFRLSRNVLLQSALTP